jgi:hypothetical protein
MELVQESLALAGQAATVLPLVAVVVALFDRVTQPKGD